MVSAIDDNRFLRRIEELTPASDLAWFIALNVGLGFTLVAAYPFAFTESGKFWAYAGLFIRAGIYLTSGERLRGRGGETLFRLFTLGIVAGTCELLIDWWLIHWVSHGRLIYTSGNDVVLLGSPVWMPLAWACVIVELGYPALRLFSIFRKKMAPMAATVVASLITAVGAGVTVGFYEYFAYRAQWWKYEPADVMIGNFCALYIPLGEFFMFLPIIPIAAGALSDNERPMTASIRGGVLFAAAIALGYGLAYFLLEGW